MGSIVASGTLGVIFGRVSMVLLGFGLIGLAAVGRERNIKRSTSHI